ncbi:hypothetical protein DEIPH_ctg052orf0021 [Deinococcus phoenicis]|uniref:Uncharacterized protein n=1 Tax=Deinococcus phoenicis TaxID=1476583 RepID=A0A016QM34_9DEIO|nr:hypothetical protein [Deinococcus phoenicis]EYB67026.1 hypothetical protein DEIPH_ctg052orf0021 [Deinococcus phoenicis]
MSEDNKLSTRPVFYVGGQLVNGKGQEVDEAGEVKAAAPAEDVAEADELLKANHDLKADLDRVTAERDQLQSQMDKTQEGYATFSVESEQRVKALTAELEELRQRPSLPADARDRLIAVKGIGEKYADDALKALGG